VTTAQFPQPPQFPPLAPHQPPAKPRRAGTIAVIVLAVIGAVAIVAGGVMVVQRFAEPEKVTISGTETIHARTFLDVTRSGTVCQGAGGYSDLSPGQIITLRNAEGQPIAKATVGAGTWQSESSYGSAGRCVIPFTFTDVVLDGDENAVFTITFGSNGKRGEVPYTLAELLGEGAHVNFGA